MYNKKVYQQLVKKRQIFLGCYRKYTVSNRVSVICDLPCNLQLHFSRTYFFGKFKCQDAGNFEICPCFTDLSFLHVTVDNVFNHIRYIWPGSSSLLEIDFVSLRFVLFIDWHQIDPRTTKIYFSKIKNTTGIDSKTFFFLQTC